MLSAIILGLVQGITEFLPVSSSGHLVLAHTLLGSTQGSLAFDVLLHVATAAAIIVYFWRDLVSLLLALLRILGRLPVDPRDKTMLLALLLGTVPGAVIGFLFQSPIEEFFRTPHMVAYSLIAGSLFFVWAERTHAVQQSYRRLSVPRGVMIGLYQVLALIPGFSRSGATIGGGMLTGLSREEATRFSFLLALPIILGGGAKTVIDIARGTEAGGFSPDVFVAAAVAFVTGLCAIRFMLRFVRTNSLYSFVFYRVLLAAVILLWW